jgi:glyoxylase-like metal-dependent hydrolase (beta-lactamase superfamily II)
MFMQVFSSGPADTNSILLACPKTHKAIIIDVPFDSSPMLLESIKKHSLQPEMILLTHSHWDHLGEAALLKEQLNIPLYVHAEDAGNVENPGSDGLPLFFPVQGVKPDGFLKDGQKISVGSLEIEVIHTPGHTPGGVCFWLPQEKVLISGDTLFQGTIGNLSFPTARPALMWESLKKLAKLPPETRVIPGHGGETTIKNEQWIVHAKEKFGG